jgi:hypothetical protein
MAKGAMMKTAKTMRITKIVDGWREADWWNDNKEFIYRFPSSVGRSRVTILIANYIDNNISTGAHFTAKALHWNIFRFDISRSAVNRSLLKLSK